MSDAPVLHKSLSVLGRYAYQCPGCGMDHFFDTKGNGPRWAFDGNMVKPTITPSVNVYWEQRVAPGMEIKGRRCHFFIKSGKMQFLPDCTHENAGKTLDMIPWDT